MGDAPERRKPGRPKAADPVRNSVSTWIASKDHDRLIRLANSREQSVSETVRQLLRLRLNS